MAVLLPAAVLLTLLLLPVLLGPKPTLLLLPVLLLPVLLGPWLLLGPMQMVLAMVWLPCDVVAPKISSVTSLTLSLPLSQHIPAAG